MPPARFPLLTSVSSKFLTLMWGSDSMARISWMISNFLLSSACASSSAWRRSSRLCSETSFTVKFTWKETMKKKKVSLYHTWCQTRRLTYTLLEFLYPLFSCLWVLVAFCHLLHQVSHSFFLLQPFLSISPHQLSSLQHTAKQPWKTSFMHDCESL